MKPFEISTVSAYMGWLWQDVVYGLRTIVKDRGFFLTAVLALALGIGSTTAIFSVIDNVLLEPFPYTDGQRLFAIEVRDKNSNDDGGQQAFAVPQFLDFQEQNHVFDRSIGVRRDGVLMTGGDAPLQFDGATVTGNTFEFLGIPPLLGRAITPEDAKPGAPPVFVLSYKVWQKKFAGDPSIVGRTFTMNDKPTTLIGIMPKRFAWWGADLWMPTSIDRSETGPTARYFFMLGHLKPGLTPQSAQPDIEIIAKRIVAQYPDVFPKQYSVRLPSLLDNVVGKFRTTLYTLLAAVGLLLLIACANVANLLLAKATARDKELAIRATLGAPRSRIVAQLMVESVLLALAGAAVGCFFAWGELKGLIALLPKFTFPDEADIHINSIVLLATLGAALLTSLIFGLVPALGAARRDLNEPLKTSGRGNSASGRAHLRNALIVSEVALSVVLLAGAGLLMRSFILQRGVDLGVRTQNVLVTQLPLPDKQYKTAELQTRFLRTLLPRIQNLPGVVNAAGALAFPPYGGINTDFDVAGKIRSDNWKGDVALCSPEFFNTMRIPLLKGRFLTEQDAVSKRKVALVNKTFATRFFGAEDPIGKQIKLAALEKPPSSVDHAWFEIVGVTGDIKNHGLRDPVQPEAFAPYTFSAFGGYVLFVRTAASPSASIKAMEQQIWSIDRNLVPQNTSSMEEMLDTSEFAKPRFGLTLFAVFAGIGLILVSVGVFSVISYTVSQRSHEIGIRLALGASAGQVKWMVITGGLRYVFVGMGVGILLAFVLTRVLASDFYGVSSYDPLTLGGVAILLTIVGTAACYLPSRRATRVDPVVSLRFE